MASLDFVKRQFDVSLRDLGEHDRNHFLIWIKENIASGTWGTVKCSDHDSDVTLKSIQGDIRAELPITAMATTETIYFPQTVQNEVYDPATTIHVDAFLYDEDTIDDLCCEGTMSRNYCKQCRSKDVAPLTFITHSTSQIQLKYIFQSLLPDLQGKIVLDVGARTGAVLYGAYLYSNANRIIGVEMDSTFCRLQKAVIDKYHMADRIEIIQDNIQNVLHLLKRADVVILHNVFEFFLPKKDQERLWQQLFCAVKENGLLITIPSLKVSLQHLQTGINLNKCVEALDTSKALQHAGSHLLSASDDVDDDLTNVHMYRVNCPMLEQDRMM